MKLKFTKMHALGNNYIYVSTFDSPLKNTDLPHIARAVSDVRRGIGADGLILIEPSNRADVGMRIFNADGSEAESCGNGLRCVAKYAFDHGLVIATHFAIETRAGIVQAQVHVRPDGVVRDVTVDMGIPRFGADSIVFRGDVTDGDEVTLRVGESVVTGTIVNVGNPHFVSLVGEIDDTLVSSLGPLIESHTAFPERINAEFVKVLNPQEIEFRVYERGSGITFACGTGACASVAALIRQRLLSQRVTVHLLGGDLDIEQTTEGHLLMSGEAVTVAEGDFHWQGV